MDANTGRRRGWLLVRGKSLGIINCKAWYKEKGGKKRKKTTVIRFLSESVEEVLHIICSSARLHHSAANVVLSSFLDIFADTLRVLYGVIIIDTLEGGRGNLTACLQYDKIRH